MGKLVPFGAAIITGATGAIVNQSGMLTSVTHTGAGDWTLNFDADYGIDANECVADIQELGAVAASGNVSYGFENTSDVAKRVTRTKEAGGGAASVLADGNFMVTLYRILP